MKIISRAALAAALLASALGILSQPASAHTAVCVGTGTANTPNLGYPATTTPPLDPATGGFTFSLGGPGSVGGCVDADLAQPVETLVATGTLEGYCGHSTGAGTINDGGGTHRFTYTSAGSVLVVTATFGGGVANAIPLPGPGNTNSCATNSANQFQVTGAVVLLQP